MKNVLIFLMILVLPAFCLAETGAEFQRMKAKEDGSKVAPRGGAGIIRKDLIIEELQRGGQVSFDSESILFHYGSPRIKDESRPQLVEIANALKQAFGDPELSKIQTYYVDGHTCNIGTSESNCPLSWARAQSAIDELVNLGIPRNKLSPRGFSFSVPATSNDTEANRQKNRRVVLTTDQAGKNPAIGPCQPTHGSGVPGGPAEGSSLATPSETEMLGKGVQLPKGFKRNPTETK